MALADWGRVKVSNKAASAAVTTGLKYEWGMSILLRCEIGERAALSSAIKRVTDCGSADALRIRDLPDLFVQAPSSYKVFRMQEGTSSGQPNVHLR